MSDACMIFEAVLVSLLESFVHQIDDVFTAFEKKIRDPGKTIEELDILLQNTVLNFPKIAYQYKGIIHTIADFATVNPNPQDPQMEKITLEKLTSALTYLCNKYKFESNRSAEQDFTMIRIASPTFQPSVFYHFQFLRCLTLVILTDIILEIIDIAEMPIPVNKIVPCAFHNVISPHRLSKIQDHLITQWSMVLFKISIVSFSQISLAFEQYMDDNNPHLVLHLVERVIAPESFMDTLVLTLQQQKKHKTITSATLSALAVFVSHLKCSQKVLEEFYKIGWGMRSTDGIKDGAIDLITTLFNRLPEEGKKAQSFYNSRVFKHVAIPSKIKRSALAFLRLIQGDISKAEFFGSLDAINFIGCAGKPFAEPFDQIFMKVFFPKAPFEVCPKVFVDILVQLAAIDMASFIPHVVVPFSELPLTDCRLPVFMSAVKIINTKRFIETAHSKPQVSHIQRMNDVMKSIVLKSIDTLSNSITPENSTQRVIGHIKAKIEECDQIVYDFLSTHKYTSFEPTPPEPKNQMTTNDEYSLATAVLGIIFSTLSPSDMKTQVVRAILKLTMSCSVYIAEAARAVIRQMCMSPTARAQLLAACIEVTIEPEIGGLQIRALTALQQVLEMPDVKISPGVSIKLEAVGLMALSWTAPVARLLGIRLLKTISFMNDNSVFAFLEVNNDVICESAKLDLLVLDVPPKPTLTAPPSGVINFEHVACSHYGSLWFFFLAELTNVIIESGLFDLLAELNLILQPRVKAICSQDVALDEIAAMSTMLLFFDTYAFDKEESDEHVRQFQPSLEQMYKSVLTKAEIGPSKALVVATRCLNWRVLAPVTRIMITGDRELYDDIAKSLAFIIQMPNNFSHLLLTAFRHFLDFLSHLQSYFISLGINNTRSMTWTDESLKLLSKHELVAVDYCIIIAAVFNNIVGQIPEEEWPITYRQILVQFLMHWSSLPTSHEKIRVYALNALIPIMKAGTIFTDGFQFKHPMLEIMVECQSGGYDVLSSLLVYHFDILFDVFVKQIFVRSRRESGLFFDAVLTSFELCSDPGMMQAHVGSLILLTQFCGRENPEPAKPILVSLADMFIQDGTPADKDVRSVIQKAQDLEFVPTLFCFATEQVIEAGFEVMKSTKLVTTVKNIVTILVGWFSKIRVLPTSRHIIQGISERFRRFTVISFLQAMSDVSKAVNEEQHDAFAQLWYELLKSADNKVVVLLCLFEIEDSRIKDLIFSQLIEREPKMVTKYLAKRCGFSYWYFLQTQKKQDIDTLMWMLAVLARAFTDFIDPEDLIKMHYSTVLHFCLLFMEQTGNCLESLISVFGPEFTDNVLVLTPDLEDGGPNIAQMTSKIAEGLHEIDPSSLDEWSAEAFRWAVGCKDIKVATRSLVVFNALRGTFHPSFVPLICDAVVYHMGAIQNDDYRNIAAYIGECFEVFFNNIDGPDVAPVAFDFAFEFLAVPDLGSKFLRRSMPIFKYCAQDPVMSTAAKDVLVQAFEPFAASLESDPEVQQLLKDIILISAPPELLLVAGVFIGHNLPFIDVERTIAEIMSTPFDAQHATVVMKMFDDMLKTASQPLVEAILDMSTLFMKNLKDAIPLTVVQPIYCVALSKVAVFRSAIEFILTVSVINPEIASAELSMISDVSPSLDSIRKKIAGMVKENTNPVPITNCKTIVQLRGLVSQKQPPKITPFATQHEMFVSLQSIGEVDPMTRVGRRAPSPSMTRRSQIMPNRSTLMQAIMIQEEELPEAPPLPEPVVKQLLLDLPKETKRNMFLVSASDFAELDVDC